MKKSCAFILATILLVTSLYTGMAATPVSADTVGETAVSGGSSELPDYTGYIEANSAYQDATQAIKINGAAFTSSTGNVEKLDSYEGRTGVARFNEENSSATYEVDIPENGLYTVLLTYRALEGRNNPISMGLMIDGQYVFDGIEEFELPRLWEDDGDVRVDGLGNEFSAAQKEVFMYNDYYVQDPLGLEQFPYCFALSAGRHTITLTSVAELAAIAEITVGVPVTYEGYEQVSAGYNGQKPTQTIKIEGEDADIKSTYSLVGKADSSDARMSSDRGQSAYLSRVNYIGNTNWQLPNERITWKINVPESGLYKIGFRYRQNYVLNGSSYRKILIDGEVPFAEAANIKFPYGVNWDYMQWNQEDGTPYLIYLEAGEHEFSMEVCLGEMTGVIRQLQDVLYDVGVTYREIVMITGETPDPNRDYALFEQIPDLETDLTSYYNDLEGIADEIERLAGQSGSSNASSIRALSTVLDKMLQFKFLAHTYKSLYYTQYTSVSALVYEMMKMALAIDYIELAPEDTVFDENKAGIFEGAVFTMERFFNSFSANYNNISGTTDAEETIDIWVNWGRDQVRVLNDLIQSSFTPQTGIGVNLRISNASYIQGILSGNGPDCSLNMPRSEPVNLALRGAMYDLKQFPDYEKTLGRFISANSVVPYTFQDGVYALPDTVTYYMMFYRTDIFEEYGYEVPKTWDEFIDVTSSLMRNNLQASLPYLQLTQIAQVNQGVGAFSIFPTLIIQQNSSIYTSDLSATNLTSAESIEMFEFWTDFYNEYKFPVTVDFFNRFRIGVMPIGIQTYTQYINLSMAAPEINGKWAMAPIPGFEDENGNINNSQAGAGTGCGILNVSQNKTGGWEFIKWWTSAETQLEYSNNCESILGVSGRIATSNVEAFKQMGWDTESLNALLDQWSKVKEVPEVPGGYYTARVIDQAYWNVVNNKKNSKDTIIEWAEVANNEIRRKREQYNVQ